MACLPPRLHCRYPTVNRTPGANQDLLGNKLPSYCELDRSPSALPEGSDESQEWRHHSCIPTWENPERLFHRIRHGGNHSSQWKMQTQTHRAPLHPMPSNGDAWSESFTSSLLPPPMSGPYQITAPNHSTPHA